MALPAPAEASPPCAGRRAAFLILGAGLLARLPLVFLPPEYVGSLWRASDTASIARNFLRNGYRLFYPQIDWGGAGPGYVETEFQIYPFLVALLYGVSGEHFWLGRLVSWGFTAGAALVFYRLALRLYGGRNAAWALAFFLGAPLYVQHSIQFMPEAALLFFYLGGVLGFVRWLDDSRPRFLLLSAAGTALSILIKPTAAHIGLVFLWMLLARRGAKALADLRVLTFGAACLAPAVAWYLHARGIYFEYGNTFGIFSGGDSKFGNVWTYWSSARFYRSLATLELDHILSYAGAVFLVAGFALLVRGDRSRLLLAGAVAVVLSYLMIPRYSRFADYYHLYSLPYAALAVGAGARSMLAAEGLAPWGRRLLRSAACLLIGWIVWRQAAFYLALLQVPAYDPTCAYVVARLVPEDARIIVSTQFRAYEDGVANNYQDPRLFYFSDRRGFCLPVERHDPDHVERMRVQGARYVVLTHDRLYYENPRLIGYLEQYAIEIGPGIEEHCAIYRLDD